MGDPSIRQGPEVFAIDAVEVAKATGMGQPINTIMQTCYFAISGVLSREEAIYQIKKAHRENLRQESRRGGATEL
jgi:pyruvate-ferredoxin/flavodoxin oxidoreductase